MPCFDARLPNSGNNDSLVLCLRYSFSDTCSRMTTINNSSLSTNVMQKSCKVHCIIVLATYLSRFTGELWTDLGEMMVQRWVTTGNFSFHRFQKLSLRFGEEFWWKKKIIKTLQSYWPTCFREETWTFQKSQGQWCLLFEASYLLYSVFQNSEMFFFIFFSFF